MNKGDKEFYDLMAQFEKDSRSMQVYMSDISRAPREERDRIKSVYYNNGRTNELFIAYMWGYQHRASIANMEATCPE